MSRLKAVLFGCLGVTLLGVSSCVGGTWYLGYQGKKALDGYLASQQEAEDQVEALQQQSGSIPEWVPIYPGTTPEEIFLNSSDLAGNGFFRVELTDSLTTAARDFESLLEEHGFSVDSLDHETGTVAMLVGTNPEESRTITVALSTRDTGVSAVVRYLWSRTRT